MRFDDGPKYMTAYYYQPNPVLLPNTFIQVDTSNPEYTGMFRITIATDVKFYDYGKGSYNEKISPINFGSVFPKLHEVLSLYVMKKPSSLT